MFFLIKEVDLNIYSEKCVLYFYATWMPFHKKMMVMLKKMEQKYNDINFFAIDAEAFKDLRKRFSIKSVPTIILLKNRNEKSRIVGLILTSVLTSTFADIYPCKKVKGRPKKTGGAET